MQNTAQQAKPYLIFWDSLNKVKFFMLSEDAQKVQYNSDMYSTTQFDGVAELIPYAVANNLTVSEELLLKAVEEIHETYYDEAAYKLDPALPPEVVALEGDEFKEASLEAMKVHWQTAADNAAILTAN